MADSLVHIQSLSVLQTNKPKLAKFSKGNSSFYNSAKMFLYDWLIKISQAIMSTLVIYIPFPAISVSSM